MNPWLVEDQQIAQQRVTRMARKKTDALSEDYTAGEMVTSVTKCYFLLCF